MAGLSNFLGHRDDPLPRGPSAGETAPPGMEFRPVQRAEIEPALRLMLANGACSSASDEQVLDFLAFSMERGLDVNATWVALRNGRICWALLPVTSPGRSMMLFSPGKLPRGTPAGAVGGLVSALAGAYRQQGVHLAQILIDPEDRAVIAAYLECGFQQLAELLYLQRRIGSREAIVTSPPQGVAVLTYAPDRHGLFADAIARSYADSLDCPALNGVREMEDVIAGHKATGEFDPGLWHVLTDARTGSALGVLLLSRTSHGDSVELVYLGLAPEARGRGLGDFLMRMALSMAAGQGRAQLALAVDSRNAPALKLYYRHGLHRIGSRIALVKDLRGA